MLDDIFNNIKRTVVFEESFKKIVKNLLEVQREASYYVIKTKATVNFTFNFIVPEQ